MPFALVFIGLMLVITGAKGTYGALGSQLKQDFTGSGNFVYWIASIGALGALGYVPVLRTFSRYFIALVLISFVLRNGGVFDKFTAAMKKGPVSTDAAKVDKAPSGDLVSTEPSGSGQTFGNILGNQSSTKGTDAQENFKTVVGVVTKLFAF